jgi:hypothetical protein
MHHRHFVAMNEPVGNPSKTLVIVLGAGFAIAAIAALVFFIKASELKSEYAQMKAQHEQDQLKIAELQPLADKARQMPITAKFQKMKDGTSAFALANTSRKTLNLQVTVTRTGKAQTFSPVIEPGKMWLLNGLLLGEEVDVACEGYESQQLTVQ